MNLRKNISEKEAECPHCKKLPSDLFLDKLQELRDACGFALPFKSIYRCPEHNKAIGGSDDSVHITETALAFGAADIGMINPRMRMQVIGTALILGFNNIEICDKHIHVGMAPPGSRQIDCMYWGISK